LASEGFKLEQINNATGEAEAIRATALARAEAIRTISNQLAAEVIIEHVHMSKVFLRKHFLVI
jgi:hypothetical protein